MQTIITNQQLIIWVLSISLLIALISLFSPNIVYFLHKKHFLWKKQNDTRNIHPKDWFGHLVLEERLKLKRKYFDNKNLLDLGNDEIWYIYIKELK